jgi:formate hydrogenlyase subunit 4
MHQPNCCANLKTYKTYKTCKLLRQTRELSIALIYKLLIANHSAVIPVGVTHKRDGLKALMSRRGPSWIQRYLATLKIAGFHATVTVRYGNH